MDEIKNKAVEAAARQLTALLYADLKSAILSGFKQIEVPIKKLSAPVFKNTVELTNAAKSGVIKDGSWVTVECKPSQFGPFLGNHYVPRIIGNNTRFRLGPSISALHPAMALIGQLVAHLKPVGLFPEITPGIHQINLYPSTTNAYGFMGFLPGINSVVPTLPAICRSTHLTFCNMPCNVTGVVRQISPSMFTSIGATNEVWESFRQRNDTWFLDLSDARSEVNPLGSAVTLETWGAMYASGHMEIEEGNLPLAPLVKGMMATFSENNFEPSCMENKGGRHEVMVFSRGLRAVICTEQPVFTLHMDAELAMDYENNRKVFDRVTKMYLDVIANAAADNSVNLSNVSDIDFSYTNSATAFSILESKAANSIGDTVGLAIRDWHRKRNINIMAKQA